ncbi:hypothetical protein [Streptomyces zaomyceticus]|uniref:hypothetical protein n=1 Tax=Streptomyces zaomyceticus TaxID=68286 RepID=UPI0037B1032A
MSLHTILTLAQPRINASEQPYRFHQLVEQAEHEVAHGLSLMELADRRWTDDPVRIAAEVETLAGLRRIAALHHNPNTCACTPCRVRVRHGKATAQ